MWQLRPGSDHGDPRLEEEARRTAAFMEPDATKIDVERSISLTPVPAAGSQAR